jgi:hypothetical protein
MTTKRKTEHAQMRICPIEASSSSYNPEGYGFLLTMSEKSRMHSLRMIMSSYFFLHDYLCITGIVTDWLCNLQRC